MQGLWLEVNQERKSALVFACLDLILWTLAVVSRCAAAAALLAKDQQHPDYESYVVFTLVAGISPNISRYSLPAIPPEQRYQKLS